MEDFNNVLKLVDEGRPFYVDDNLRANVPNRLRQITADEFEDLPDFFKLVIGNSVRAIAFQGLDSDFDVVDITRFQRGKPEKPIFYEVYLRYNKDNLEVYKFRMDFTNGEFHSFSLSKMYPYDS